MTAGAGLRELPIRVPVAAGESLHSWIEALAARYRMTVRELLPALGLPQPRSPYDLIRGIGGDALRSLERQAGIPCGRLDDAVLDRYAGLGLAGVPGRRSAEGRQTLWARATGSGFCPRCLRETGGRWALAWHLNWTFACTRHNVLMASRCAACGRRPRAGEDRYSHLIDARRCCHAGPQPGQARRGPGGPRCGAPLTGQPVAALGPGHPVIAAQRWVDGVLAAHAGGRPVTAAGLEVPAATALAAAAALMRYAVLQEGDLASRRVAHLAAGPAGEGIDLPQREPTGSAAGVYAAVTGDPALFGTAAALAADVLAAPTLTAAAEAVSWMIAPDGRRTTPAGGQWPSKLEEADTGSPLADAIALRQRAALLKPATRLTYRTDGPLPRRPDGPQREWPLAPGRMTSVPARLVPQVAWGTVAAALSRRGAQDTGADGAALSMALVRCGTYTEWTQIAAWLALPGVGKSTLAAFWRHLARDGRLEEVLAGINALAEALTRDPPPIDYARRRHVFRDLDPATPARLRRACHAAGLALTGRRRRHATMMLWETITGGDIRFHDGSLAPLDPDDRTEYALFRDSNAGGLADWLALEAERLLLRHRIDEPVTWQPEPEGPAGQAWRSPPPDLARRLPGWDTPSRQGTMRRAARDHTASALARRLPRPPDGRGSSHASGTQPVPAAREVPGSPVEAVGPFRRLPQPPGKSVPGGGSRPSAPRRR